MLQTLFWLFQCSKNPLCPHSPIIKASFCLKSAKTFLTSVFQCCLWFAKNRDCDEILPYHGFNTDKLGFESSKIILATDLTHQSKQSLIFAFGEGTAEVAIGYFPQMAKGMTKMPRVRKNKTKKSFSHTPPVNLHPLFLF